MQLMLLPSGECRDSQLDLVQVERQCDPECSALDATSISSSPSLRLREHWGRRGRKNGGARGCKGELWNAVPWVQHSCCPHTPRGALGTCIRTNQPTPSTGWRLAHKAHHLAERLLKLMAEGGERVTFHWVYGCHSLHIYVHTDSTNWTQRVIDFTMEDMTLGERSMEAPCWAGRRE